MDLPEPKTDPAAIIEHFRGAHATELLTAAVAHLDLFGILAQGPVAAHELRATLGLSERAYTVLLVAMRAMGLVRGIEVVEMTPLAAEHLTPGGPFEIASYVGLAADSPGVGAMVERLRTDRPAGAADKDGGAAFIFREGIESAMEREASARRLTLALAGRARNVAPALARNYPLDGVETLLDVGGGTGIYAYAYLRRHAGMRAIVFDRPEVLKVARERAEEYGVADRVELVAGDMFADALPAGCDAVLLSNVLHDWDVAECRTLVGRCAAALPVGGRLLVHDVFLEDTMDGPLPLALYSASLFSLTEGRAYSAAEYRGWLEGAGLRVGGVVPTLAHCGVIPATK